MEDNTLDIKEIIISEPQNISKQPPEKEKDFMDVLRMFAPGTSIRSALDDLLNAHMGALVVFENEKVLEIIEKGFRINAKFSPQRLVELAKMDGAIILSADGKKILYANTLLAPDVNIFTKETGTRHKAGERTAKQARTLVIAVSERKNKITIYYCDLKYELKESSEILRRAAETLQILEKQREIYNDLMSDFNLLEINNLVTINDVSAILQRIEIIKRISSIVKRYLVELGKEGIVVSIRLKELVGNIQKDEDVILKDYFLSNHLSVVGMLDNMNFDFLLEIPNVSRMLFPELHDNQISPRGLRLLSKTNILERYRSSLTDRFKSLNKILSASDAELLEVFENSETLNSFDKEMNNLREKIMARKDIDNFI
ncbi:MAG: DNA integrity scanning diadenylate cyclase DisA [Nanoarchaeota archaeon]